MVAAPGTAAHSPCHCAWASSISFAVKSFLAQARRLVTSTAARTKERDQLGAECGVSKPQEDDRSDINDRIIARETNLTVSRGGSRFGLFAFAELAPHPLECFLEIGPAARDITKRLVEYRFLLLHAPALRLICVTLD